MDGPSRGVVDGPGRGVDGPGWGVLDRFYTLVMNMLHIKDLTPSTGFAEHRHLL